MKEDVRSRIRWLLDNLDDRASRDSVRSKIWNDKDLELKSVNKKGWSVLQSILSEYGSNQLDQTNVEDLIERRLKKGATDVEEERRPRTAFRQVGHHIYRMCIKDGVARFARYDQVDRRLAYVDSIMETGELPLSEEQWSLATFPRELKPYGTKEDLYNRVKARISWCSQQQPWKNHIVALYILYHGCYNPFQRKNLQLILLGLPATGKGRFCEILLQLGDRARLVTMLLEATSQRQNTLLNGGLEIIDESPNDKPELEAYIRSRYDPLATNPRILDPHTVDRIVGFKVAGPTIITRRRSFADDANTDRGIVLECLRGDEFPMEVLDKTEEMELQDMLALFWSEHYDSEQVLPNQDELWYRKSDTIDPRLKLASVYLGKVAKLVGPAADIDLGDFISNQETIRRQLKATTIEGSCIRAIWDIIQEYSEEKGHSYHKDGKQVIERLAAKVKSGGEVAVWADSEIDDGNDAKVDQKPINWRTISYRAALKSRDEPGPILRAHGIDVMQTLVRERKNIRTLNFRLDKLDSAFKNFLTEYDPSWKNRLGTELGKQRRLEGE